MMSGLLPVCAVGSTIQLLYLQDFFRLISVYGHSGVCCLICLPFPSISYSAVQHTLYHVSLYTVILPVLDMLIRCVLLSLQIVDSLHLQSVPVCNIFVA